MRIAVQAMLKSECATAMVAAVAGRDKNAGWSMARTTQKTTSMTAVPMMLKLRWTTAARFAFVFAPMDESIAVTHVPMFWPIMMGMAEAMVIAPVLAKACKTPTEADDDWMIAVKTAPASTPSSGFENKSRRLRKLSLERSGDTAPLIASMPYIRTAKPSKIEPVSFCRSLPAMMRMIPMSASTGVKDEGFRS